MVQRCSPRWMHERRNAKRCAENEIRAVELWYRVPCAKSHKVQIIWNFPNISQHPCGVCVPEKLISRTCENVRGLTFITSSARSNLPPTRTNATRRVCQRENFYSIRLDKHNASRAWDRADALLFIEAPQLGGVNILRFDSSRTGPEI